MTPSLRALVGALLVLWACPPDGSGDEPEEVSVVDICIRLQAIVRSNHCEPRVCADGGDGAVIWYRKFGVAPQQVCGEMSSETTRIAAPASGVRKRGRYKLDRRMHSVYPSVGYHTAILMGSEDFDLRAGGSTDQRIEMDFSGAGTFQRMGLQVWLPRGASVTRSDMVDSGILTVQTQSGLLVDARPCDGGRIEQSHRSRSRRLDASSAVPVGELRSARCLVGEELVVEGSDAEVEVTACRLEDDMMLAGAYGVVRDRERAAKLARGVGQGTDWLWLELREPDATVASRPAPDLAPSDDEASSWPPGPWDPVDLVALEFRWGARHLEAVDFYLGPSRGPGTAMPERTGMTVEFDELGNPLVVGRYLRDVPHGYWWFLEASGAVVWVVEFLHGTPVATYEAPEVVDFHARCAPVDPSE